MAMAGLRKLLRESPARAGRPLLFGICAAVILAGCGSPPAFKASYFNAAGVSMGGDGARTGQVMYFPARLLSDAPSEITLVSAQLIPIPDFQTPRLVHLTVAYGCELVVPSAGWGWPPQVQAQGGTAALHDFAGDKIWTGTSGMGCYHLVIYGITTTSTGPFAVGGLRVTFKSGSGGLQTSPIFNGGFSYYIPAKLSPQEAAKARKDSDAANSAAFNALNKIAGYKQGT